MGRYYKRKRPYGFKSEMRSILYRIVYLGIIYFGIKHFGLSFVDDIIFAAVGVVAFELVGLLIP